MVRGKAEARGRAPWHARTRCFERCRRPPVQFMAGLQRGKERVEESRAEGRKERVEIKVDIEMYICSTRSREKSHYGQRKI